MGLKKFGLLIAISGVFSLVAAMPTLAAPTRHHNTQIVKVAKTQLGYKRMAKNARMQLPEWGKKKAKSKSAGMGGAG